MNTEHLIRALAMDGAQPVTPIGRSLFAALAIGVVLSGALFFVILHPRPDIAAVADTLPFVFKFIFALSLAATAAAVLVETARPLPRFRWQWGLMLAPLLLATGVVVELITMPAHTWPARLVGHNAAHCLSLIPLLSLAPAVCILIALRRGAPARPALAGAVAGLVSGGLGAALYALTCPEDSPLFVATWYSIAIAVVTAVSAYAGSRALRW
jgi:hypothetical protein